MELILIVIAILSPIVAGYFALNAYSANADADEALRVLKLSSAELQRLRALRETAAIHSKATNISLTDSRYQNIHLDGMVRQKTKALQVSNDALWKVRGELERCRKELRRAKGTTPRGDF